MSYEELKKLEEDFFNLVNLENSIPVGVDKEESIVDDILIKEVSKAF